ncbi:HU family DNA-binding protein [Bacteroidales bacterium OttesenSCG-928-L03]|nr:HU family DNA-binding protein [Bacteroidales bacterium OttesenSCG-928-L03]
MNSAELTSALSDKLDLTKQDVLKRMDALAEIMTSELTQGNTIAVTTFGSFEVKKRNERISFHPTTKQKLLIPPKLVLSFKPALSLKDKCKTLVP